MGDTSKAAAHLRDSEINSNRNRGTSQLEGPTGVSSEVAENEDQISNHPTPKRCQLFHQLDLFDTP